MSDPTTVADYIRRAALARGIDPDTALRVFKQESGFNPAARNVSDKEESYGVAQLNVRGGLGAVARQQGIEPSDPTQWPRHVDFALDTVKNDGWRQWYGARDVGIGRWDGVGGAAPQSQATPVYSPPVSGTGHSSVNGPDTQDIASVFRMAANPPQLSLTPPISPQLSPEGQEPTDFQGLFDPRTTRRGLPKRHG